MSSSRYDPGAVRERTQLFANARPYSPSLAMRASPNSARESPAPAAYNDAVYDQLESQHDEQIGGLSAKVSVLKDLSQRIGTEVREGTSLLGSLEDRFSNARTSVRNTMTRMIQTADRRGVSWRSWLTLIGIILFCFWLVLLL